MRRWLGRVHIPRRFAPLVHEFTQDVLSPAVNFHRPCMFAVEHVDAKGRVRRRYPHDQVVTPYDRLRGLDGAEGFLKPGVSFADLDRAAHAVSDLAALREVNHARAELFRTIGLAPAADSAA